MSPHDWQKVRETDFLVTRLLSNIMEIFPITYKFGHALPMTKMFSHHSALKVVAWLFIGGGVLDFAGTVYSLCAGHFHVDFGFLTVLVGIGLLSRWPSCLTIALVLTWGMLLFLPLLSVYALLGSEPLGIHLFNIRLPAISRAALICVGILGFALTLWQRHVLTRPEVSLLFCRSHAEPPLSPDGQQTK